MTATTVLPDQGAPPQNYFPFARQGQFIILDSPGKEGAQSRCVGSLYEIGTWIALDGPKQKRLFSNTEIFS
jgi:hypothetical protein